jgi:hypothetical protein
MATKSFAQAAMKNRGTDKLAVDQFRPSKRSIRPLTAEDEVLPPAKIAKSFPEVAERSKRASLNEAEELVIPQD